MPRRSNNPTTTKREGIEYDLGSLPLGSAFECYSPSPDNEGELVVRGFVMGVSEFSGRVEVFLTSEGDGNFSGDDKNGTMLRIHKLNEIVIMNNKNPVVWLGVDEEVRKEILANDPSKYAGTDGTSNGNDTKPEPTAPDNSEQVGILGEATGDSEEGEQ